MNKKTEEIHEAYQLVAGKVGNFNKITKSLMSDLEKEVRVYEFE